MGGEVGTGVLWFCDVDGFGVVCNNIWVPKWLQARPVMIKEFSHPQPCGCSKFRNII